MTLIAERIYTVEEFEKDHNLSGYELVDGHLRERLMSERSSLVAGEIFALLRNEAKKTREALVYPSDLGYQCFPDSNINLRFPDVSLVRAARRKEIGDDPGYMTIPADLAVEVLSPNDVVKAVGDKVKEYLKAGFGAVWVVDPDWRHVHIYRQDGSVQLFTEQEEIAGEAALPSFRCKVAEFFDV
jgi:Uma2 family endonuclease